MTNNKSDKKKNYVYDLETYPNFFCGVFMSGQEVLTFEISARRNQLEELQDFYSENNIQYAIGFNNIGFDAQVLHFLLHTAKSKPFEYLPGSQLVGLIYDFAQSVIQKSKDNEFPPYAEWHFKVPQIDLFLMNHYNNKNKMTSLKWIEFSLNHNKVQDLPYRFDQPLHSDTFDEILEYCCNDVRATREFADVSRDLIKLRLKQNEQYPDLRLLNKPDSSVGEQMFLHFMSESMGIPKKELKEMRTHRGHIRTRDILLPYINFKTPEMQPILEYYQEAVFGEWDFEKNKPKSLSKTIRFKGIDFEFGEGGIHASWNHRIFESDSEFQIVDIDVTSYYPNLAIKNGYKPEHLGDAFLRVYENIFEQRKTFPKGSIENLSYKIILNGSYGKFGDQYSFLYDPRVMLQICLNGQLLIAMLCERLSFIPDLTLIQANTDGVTVRIRRKDLEQMNRICRAWEKLTSLELETQTYRKMVISNVNNYMAQTEDGKIKDKGALYLVNPEPHKNKSQRIVQIALRQYFFSDVPIRETIESHLSNTIGGLEWDPKKEKFAVPFCGIYDFCLGKKVKWNQTFVLLKGMSEKDIGQKVIRYYITQERATMMKKYSDGRISAVNKGYRAKLFQNYEPRANYGINYEYYVNEAYKITTGFEGGNPKQGKQLSLFEL